MEIDINKLNDKVKPKINEGSKDLENAANILQWLDIPSNFEYKNLLRNMPEEIKDIKNNVNSVNKWVEETIELFRQVEVKNNNFVNELFNVGNNILSTLPKDTESSTAEIDSEKDYKTDNPNAKKGESWVSKIVGTFSENTMMILEWFNIIGDNSDVTKELQQNKKIKVENYPTVADNIANYLKNTYTIEIDSSSISTVQNTDEGRCLITLKDGVTIKIYYEEQEIRACVEYLDNTKIVYNRIGVISMEKNGKDIYGVFNEEYGNYGGNQLIFASEYNSNLVEDRKMQEIVREYWPNATYEDIEGIINRVNINGCGYVAMVNTLFKQYEGREKEFAEKFGYNMFRVVNFDSNSDKDKRIEYNYEYLILEYFCYVHSKISKDIRDIYDSDYLGETQPLSFGTDKEKFKMYESFMKEKYNIDCKVINNDSDYELIERYKTLYSKFENTHTIVTAKEYELLFPDGGTFIKEGEDGHVMYITGISDNGCEFKVSSWGAAFLMPCSKANIENINEKEGYIYITTVTYY